MMNGIRRPVHLAAHFDILPIGERSDGCPQGIKAEQQSVPADHAYLQQRKFFYGLPKNCLAGE